MIVVATILAAAISAKACDATSVLAEMREASGGDRWKGVAELSAAGQIDDAGSTGTFVVARDVETGRSRWAESLPVGRVIYIYDGHTKWEVDDSGGVHALDAPDSKARAITDAYIDRNGFWSSAAAVKTTCSASSDASRTFDVVRMTPPGGESADIWIDRATHLIDRKVEQWPTTTMVETYADYRRTDGVVVPYRITRRYTDQFGAPAAVTEIVRSYRLTSTVNRSDFTRPENARPGRIFGRTDSATAPFELDHGVIVFSATVNGRGPFAFTLDPGAQGVLTKVAAEPLGFAVGQMHRVQTIRIGEAEISGIDLPVYGGSPSDLFTRRSAGRPAIAGTLGPEILDRFDVRLNFQAKTMALAARGSLSCAKPGVDERFVTQEDDDIPLVNAAVDGDRGLFQFDLRSPTSVVLFKPFLDRTGISKPSTSALDSVASLWLGGSVLEDVPARFMDAVTGKFASRTEAGLLGTALLSRFVISIEYGRGAICFQAVR